jgi:hypothetical protein
MGLTQARAFSPLADQRWVTVALAYVKELDVIQTKRQELAGTSTGAPKVQPLDVTGKPKAQPKKKGKGGGKGASSSSAAQDAEEE